MGIDTEALARLREHVHGTVYVRGDEGLAAEVACFNPAIRHDPDVVVAVESEEDVAEAVRFAREHDLPVRVQATGHGEEAPTVGGLIVSTRALDSIVVDAPAHLVRLGAGVRWAPVIERTAEHGLAPVAGSSTSVGAVGYTLGGGLGPLARTHGFTADWVRGFRVVTAHGEIVSADPSSHPHLFWALRGGKGGLGVVTEMTLELVPLTTLYAGSVFFEGDAIEPAFRAWVDWAAGLGEEATTSVVLLRVPDVDGPPPPLRGRTVLSVRFAYPGDSATGERLFAPIREAAAVFIDAVAEIPTTAVASIHNDPEQGSPSWIRGFMLDDFDAADGDALLDVAGPRVESPFLALEIRQLGGAAHRDTADGTAVGGRDSGYTLSAIAADPATFDSAAPAATEAISRALQHRISAVTNANWATDLTDPTTFESAWPAVMHARLTDVRASYDPDRVFAFGPS
ncbi:FAD-binding oxidoreductase [Leifsonia sp. McL0607]|uniref:FAD-binding oxidoreductase n=1 Tax=Leifsonia sp. McL0607 TaxID=3415672 RepID=UPI003CF28362